MKSVFSCWRNIKTLIESNWTKRLFIHFILSLRNSWNSLCTMNSHWAKIIVPFFLSGAASLCTAQNTATGIETSLDFRDQPHLSFDAIFDDFHPKLIKVFDPLYLNISEDTHYDHYLTHMGLRMEKRPRFIHIKIVSHKFDTVPTEDVSIFLTIYFPKLCFLKNVLHHFCSNIIYVISFGVCL